jgi:hypothetical protein
MTSQSPIVYTVNTWNPRNIKFGKPKKTGPINYVSVIDKASNMYPEISTPRMMTWGIADFPDETTGTGNGRFSMTLNFPEKGSEYENPQTSMFLQKLEELKAAILDGAYDNRSDWFKGNPKFQTRQGIEFAFSEFIKHPKKEKGSAEVDYNRASINLKVQKKDDEWKIGIFDTNQKCLYPSTEATEQGYTPPELVPKMANVTCTFRIAGVWLANNDKWGVTFNVSQIVVKPSAMALSNNVCRVVITDEDAQAINEQTIDEAQEMLEVDEETGTVYKAGETVTTVPKKAAVAPAPVVEAKVLAEESDNEAEPEVAKPVAVAPPAPELTKRKVVVKGKK